MILKKPQEALCSVKHRGILNQCSGGLSVKYSSHIFSKHILLEPVGAKAPSFSSDSKGSIFVREQGQSFALLCQAQGSPVPIYR